MGYCVATRCLMPRKRGGGRQNELAIPEPVTQPFRLAGTAQAVTGAIRERFQHHLPLEHHHTIDLTNTAAANQVVRDIDQPVAAAAMKYRDELQLVVGHPHTVNGEQYRDIGPPVAVDVADHGAPQCALFVAMYPMRKCRDPLVNGVVRSSSGGQRRQQHRA